MALKKIYLTLTTGYTVSDPQLVFARIHRVFRGGITDRPLTGSAATNRAFYFDPATGTIEFGEPANGEPGGEQIEIVFDGGSPAPPEPPPIIYCAPVSLAMITVNPDKTATINLPGVGNYSIGITDISNECADIPVEDRVTVMSNTYTTPVLPNGDYVACVKRICGPGSESNFVLQEFIIADAPTPPPPGNMEVRNACPSGAIDGVSPAFFIADVDTFPILPGGDKFMMHGDYIGTVTVRIKFPFTGLRYIKLLVNGAVFYNEPAVVGNNYIPSVSIIASDNIEIIYTTTP